jgi:hypothetical protein
MSVNVPTWYVQQYNTNIQQLVQQKPSRLRAAVSSGSHVGASASPVDQVGAVEMLDVTTRDTPMRRVDAATDRRWVAPLDAELPQRIDTFDKLRLLTDPQSAYVRNAVSAANRKFDDRILNAFFASAMTGVTGATSTAFDTTNQVVGVDTGGTGSNINVAKLDECRRIFLANEVDLEAERIHLAITSKEDKALRSEIRAISFDYNEKPIIDPKTGLIMEWNGFVFHHSERSVLTTTQTDDQAGSSRAIPAWVPSGMYLGIWNDIETSIDVRADLSGRPWQAYTKMSANATRTEEKKVVKIWCR